MKTTTVLLLDKTVRMLVSKSYALYYHISITEHYKEIRKSVEDNHYGEGRIGGFSPTTYYKRMTAPEGWGMTMLSFEIKAIRS